jgi:hypothetical protein
MVRDQVNNHVLFMGVMSIVGGTLCAGSQVEADATIGRPGLGRTGCASVTVSDRPVVGRVVSAARPLKGSTKDVQRVVVTENNVCATADSSPTPGRGEPEVSRCAADHAPDSGCEAEALREPAAEPKPEQSPGRLALATTAPGLATPAQLKPEQADTGETKVKPEQAEPVLIKVNLAESREARTGRAPRVTPKTTSIRRRGLDPVIVPPAGLPVPVPAVVAPPAMPVVAPAPELVLSQRAPVLVADAAPSEPEQVAENAELASALRSSSVPSGAVDGSTTGLAAVGGLLVLGLVSTRLTAKGRKRRSAPGTAR